MGDILEEYPPILTIAEVATILGISNNTVRKLIKDNSIQSIKIGRRYKITKSKLLSYLGESTE